MTGLATARSVLTGNQGLSCPQHLTTAVHNSIRWNVPFFSQGWFCATAPGMYQACITLLADCDFIKSIQMRLLSTLRNIECLKSFCSESNRRSFGRKIIDMIPSIIEAMIHERILWWRRSMLVIAHN